MIKKISVVLLFAIIIMFGVKTNNVFATELTQSIKINNTNLSFNKVIYVSDSIGSDVSGDGTSQNPYKSISKAQSVAVDGDAIYI